MEIISWIVTKQSSQEELAEIFSREMLKPEIFQLPGAYDGMSALIAKQTGFKGLYLSGAAYTASRGIPDLGMITSEEMVMRAKDLIRSADLPVLVDIDTGYGGILNIARTAKEMYEARVAAVQIEDQVSPKKCGHLNGKRLISTEEMVQKIKVIKETSPSLIVIARTDAASVAGLDEVIERSNQYAKAGADAIFPEALSTEQDFKNVKQKVEAPLLSNMTEFGRTNYYTADEFEALGYSMVIYPVTALRIAAKAIENIFEELMKYGTQLNSLSKMQSRKELYDIINYYDYEKLDEKIANTVLPEVE